MYLGASRKAFVKDFPEVRVRGLKIELLPRDMDTNKV